MTLKAAFVCNPKFSFLFSNTHSSGTAPPSLHTGYSIRGRNPGGDAADESAINLFLDMELIVE